MNPNSITDIKSLPLQQKAWLAIQSMGRLGLSAKGVIYEHSLKLMLSKSGLKCHPSSILIGEFSNQTVECGSNVHLGVYSVLFVGDDPAGGAEKGSFHFGTNVYIGDHCNLRAAGGIIKIGSNVLIANHVTMVSSNHGFRRGTPIMNQPWSKSPSGIEIGDDCWIGTNSTLIAGAKVMNGAIVAAGAVVRSVVPQYEIWGGVPARKIGERPL